MAKVTSYIVFQVADTSYAISTEMVQQMEMVEQVTKAPNTPDYVDGVAFLRGQVVPVINLRSRFGYERIEYDIRSRLIVINIDGRVVGLAVDTAREYLTIPDDQILPPPAMINEENGNFVQGMFSLNERLVMLLDVTNVLSKREKAHLEVID